MSFSFGDLNPDSLSGFFDQSIGTISNEATRKSYINIKHPKKISDISEENEILNLHNYVICLNQFSSVLEGYCGENFEKPKVLIERLTQGHKFNFEHPIEPKNSTSYLRDSFSLKEGAKNYFLLGEKIPTDQGFNSHGVEKNAAFLKSYPYLVKTLQNSIDRPNDKYTIKEVSGTEKFKESSLKKINLQKFVDRINLANEFDSCFISSDYKDFKKKNISNEIKSHYDEKSFHKHVGILRSNPDQTILFFQSCYETKEIMELEDANAALNHFVPNTLENFCDMKGLVRKALHQCSDRENLPKCYIAKLLARPKNSKKICVLYFASFSSSIFFHEKLSNIPSGMILDFFKKSIFGKDWEVYWPKKKPSSLLAHFSSQFF